MGLFRKKSPIPIIEYDAERQMPILKCSICTGEQVAGFKDKQTGRFTDVMLIEDKSDLDAFMKMYNLDTVTKEY